MHAGNGTSSLDQAAREFTAARPQLFGIAYRMLGSAVEAEDIVQEAWLRWQNADRTDIREPAAFLTTITTRLAINFAQSARVRREAYIGPWLPEPIDTSTDPYVGAEKKEALELAVLFLLERLNPTERAAYILREAFDYPYKQVATMLETSEANCRQLVSRARKHLADEHRQPVSQADHRRLMEAFVSAAQTGNLSQLEELLATMSSAMPTVEECAGHRRSRSSDVTMFPSTLPPSHRASGPIPAFDGWRPTASRLSSSCMARTPWPCCPSKRRTRVSTGSCGY